MDVARRSAWLALPMAAVTGLFGCEPGTLACTGVGSSDGHCPRRGESLVDEAPGGEGEGEGEPRCSEDETWVDGACQPDPIVRPPPEALCASGEPPPCEGVEIPVVGSGCAPEAINRPAAEPSGGQGGPPEGYEGEIEIEGMRHPYRVMVPECYDPSRPWGLAVVLHDTNADRGYLAFKWADTARDREYVVLLPEARRTFDNQAVWAENPGANRALVMTLVAKVEAEYQIDTRDTVLAGLGAGATFSVDLGILEETPFEFLFAVNTSVYEATVEQGLKAFVLAGEREAEALSARESTDRFRYEYVAKLGPFYPGPSYPPIPGDPGSVQITNQTALDWFHASGP